MSRQYTITKAAPPVAERPRCPGCNKPMRPVMHTTWARNAEGFETTQLVAKEWAGTYRGYGVFCSLICCDHYANTMFHRHGTRFTNTGRPL